MMKKNTVLKALISLVFMAGAWAASAQSLYWEKEFVLQPQGVRFSQSAAGGGLLAVGWQEIVQGADGRQDIFISIAVSRDGEHWTKNTRLYGPIPYTEPDPSLHPLVYSILVDDRGRILMAFAAKDTTTVILLSEDGGKSFRETARLESKVTAVTPSLFASAGGGYILFVTDSLAQVGGAAAEEYLSISFSASSDGASWSAFAPLITEETLRYNLSPQHASFRGKDYVVFQSRSEMDTYQLYLKASSDGGRTWDNAREITRLPAFNEVQLGKAREAIELTNQRGNLAPLSDGLGLVWERNLPGARPQLYFCRIAEDGSVATTPEKVATTPESILGQIIPFRDGFYVLYSDTSLATSRVIISRKGAIWEAQTLNLGIPGVPSNPHAAVFANQILIFWETISAGGSSLLERRPVTHVDPPVLVAADFTPNKRSSRSAVSVRWNDPPDPAGIRTYRYTWSINAVVKVQRDLSQSNPRIALAADADGAWELSVTAEDFAGNVSVPAKISFIRDTTPPKQPVIGALSLDSAGYLISNTFTVSWSSPADDEIARYTYGMKYLGIEAREVDLTSVGAGVVPQKTETEAPKAFFDDQDDGSWVFAVSAIDTAGNIGPPAFALVRLNKFVPYTAVYRVKENSDEFGVVTLTIEGRGFTTNGAIESISLSAQGKPPYDYEFLRSRGDFAVMNDRFISGPKLTSEVKSGSYMLSMYHPQRRTMVWKGGLVTFEAPGTIKIGNFRLRYLPPWVAERVPLYAVSTSQILLAVFMAFIGTLIVLSARKMVVLVQEGAMVREEVTALIEGRPSAGLEERNRKMQELQRKGAGLRLKYTLLMIVLVILIVLIVSVPLSLQMVNRQRAILTDNLTRRSEILIGSLATSAENQIRSADREVAYADMALVPSSISVMADALWATISGPGKTDTTGKDYVWASNDPAWMSDHPGYSPATETATDQISSRVDSVAATIETEARQKIEPLFRQNDANYTRYLDLALKMDPKSQEEAVAALNVYIKGNAENNAAIKSDVSFSWMRSSPEFNVESLQPVYVFYKPIVFASRAKDANGDLAKDAQGNNIYSYYQGMVRLCVSTTLITKQIIDARASLIRITGLIALAAVALGVLGAIILASITVTPIKKLAAGVAIIRDTEDKEELKSHSIEVHTRDEIGMLADTVNDMTKGLVKAAIANKELMVGKDVQKMFLPLEKDAENKKGATGGEDNPQVEIYGYYEGAKGVSGDYFDFKKLDDAHYAIIKCDVAGKGVPAALIMVEVATLFISYFRDWVKRKEELALLKDPDERKRHQAELDRVDTLVYTINDMIEERAFKGRFAQLTVCLFNSKTGIARICHAGDKILNIYQAGLGRMTHKELNDVPAAGVFPSMLLEMKSGFKQIEQKLGQGDALFLFTDGFEESKRAFRDENYQIAACNEPGLKEGEIHLETHSKGSSTEEFGTPRIDGVVNAVFNGIRYRLVRHHSPIPNEEIVFDFSTCSRTVKDAVLALVAVEKVFRLWQGPTADAASKVVVDAKVDAFLKEHFLQYPVYFGHRLDGQADGQAVTFTHLHEDDQYDDLTMLVVRRK